MTRYQYSVLVLLLTVSLRADDAITPAVIQSVKHATVYIRVECGAEISSGSGFVAAVDGETIHVVTNHHVAVTSLPAKLTVFFDSGTRSERKFSAEVVAADVERDLAVLRLSKVSEPPTPLAWSDPPEPFETMGVYTFGFPFGEDLSTGKRAPAITVGRASVSSLRTGDDGELSTIQIDGNLNPGNSGGPAVDGRGRLLGVAVAIHKDAQGIGFLVPAADVVQLMAGRLGSVRLSGQKGADGKAKVRLDINVIDPLGKFRGVTAHVLPIPAKGKRPDSATLSSNPAARRLPLTVTNGVASGELEVEDLNRELAVQVIAERTDGKTVSATRIRTVLPAVGPGANELAGPPPTGWVDFQPKDKGFAIWLPSEPKEQTERSRDIWVNNQTMKLSGVMGRTADGLAFQADAITLPQALVRETPVVLHELFRRILRPDASKARFTESVEARIGSLFGVQYQIESADEVIRARVFISAARRVWMVRVVGTAEQVGTPEATTILRSFRLPGERLTEDPAPSVATIPPNRTAPPPGGRPAIPRTVPPASPAGPRYEGADPYILGTIRDPRYKAVGPKGGLLVGIDAKFTKFGHHDIVRGVRPIYRVNGKLESGDVIGLDPAQDGVSLRAKDGYAVGGMAGKANWWCHGFALIYMKVKADGTLDPRDSYESEWVGWDGQMDVIRFTGDGTAAVGIVGKIVRGETTALGLLFKGQEAFDPAAEPRSERQVRSIPFGKDPYIFGTIRDPEFKSPGPAGGIMIGLEAKFIPFGHHQIVRGVRPIYRVEGKETFGDTVGVDPAEGVVLKAKEGYAVGAISGKAGWWCNGFALTFMKIKNDGTLDPADSYESEWVGWNGDSELLRSSGGGAVVVGVVGKIVGNQTTCFGLMFQGQEGFQPAKRR